MRQLRNFKTNHCYHLISRIANRAFFLTDDERTRFVDRMWRVARFSGVEILAYCFMSNHFHLLVYLPETTVLSDAELMDRVAALYSDSRLAEIRKEWETYCAANDAARMDAFRQRFLRRMFDCVPRLLARGNNKVAFDILKLLGEGAKRPKELRAALGIASVNFFTARYLTPLVEAGYIAPEDNASANSPNRKYKLTQKGIMMV